LGSHARAFGLSMAPQQPVRMSAFRSKASHASVIIAVPVASVYPHFADMAGLVALAYSQDSTTHDVEGEHHQPCAQYSTVAILIGQTPSQRWQFAATACATLALEHTHPPESPLRWVHAMPCSRGSRPARWRSLYDIIHGQRVNQGRHPSGTDL
jgi:hypothetical protein